MPMSPLYSLFISFFISLLVVSWIHPRLVKIALLKNLVDNPDSRKLQRQPVPVLGGIAVFFGIVIGYGSVCGMVNYAGMLIVIMAMMVMIYIGTMDDILSLSPALRFAVEFFVALLLIFNGGYLLDDFHGLWGVGMLPDWMAVNIDSPETLRRLSLLRGSGTVWNPRTAGGLLPVVERLLSRSVSSFSTKALEALHPLSLFLDDGWLARRGQEDYACDILRELARRRDLNPFARKAYGMLHETLAGYAGD